VPADAKPDCGGDADAVVMRSVAGMMDATTNRVERLQTDNATLRARLAETEGELEQAHSTIGTLQNHLDYLTTHGDDCEHERRFRDRIDGEKWVCYLCALEAADQERDRFREVNQELSGELEQANERVRELEQRIDLMTGDLCSEPRASNLASLFAIAKQSEVDRATIARMQPVYEATVHALKKCPATTTECGDCENVYECDLEGIRAAAVEKAEG